MGADGPSPAHGRQRAGLSRVGLRSAEKRDRQGAGFEGKEIFKDHGSLNRSLVTFCRRRKSLALRRNRSRAFRDRPPDAERKQRGRGKPCPTCRECAGVCRTPEPYTAGRPRGAAPTENPERSSTLSHAPMTTHARRLPVGGRWPFGSPRAAAGGREPRRHTKRRKERQARHGS